MNRVAVSQACAYVPGPPRPAESGILLGMSPRLPLAARLALAGGVVLSGGLARGQGCPVELASPALGGATPTGGSIAAAISADGDCVVFESLASNLVPGDTNGHKDVFHYRRSTGVLTRVSVSSAGLEANADCYLAAISGHGSTVVFTTKANLDPRDTDAADDVYLHDVDTGRLLWVSGSATDARPDGPSTLPRLSANGRFVAYQSQAANLVPGDTNGVDDIFVFDRLTRRTARVNVGPDGSQANDASSGASPSADGRFVAFASRATNLIPGGDLNGSNADVFVHDRSLGRTWLVSVDHQGLQRSVGYSQNPWISGDGRRVAFLSTAGLVPGNPAGKQADVDIFVFDADLGTSRIVSVSTAGAFADKISSAPTLSLDGRCVAYGSRATNLVPGDTNGFEDVFVHDLLLAETRRASTSASGAEGNASSFRPGISADGTAVCFDTTASNLLAAPTHALQKILVQDCGAPARPAARVPGAAPSAEAGALEATGR